MTKTKAKKVPAPVDPRPAPDERQNRAFERAAERYRDRAEPLTYDKQPEGARTIRLKSPHSDDAGQLLHALDTFGTASYDFAQHGVGRLAAVMRDRKEPLPTDTAFNMSLAAMSGIAPENEIEAMLAVQMVGTHEVAMEMLTRAKLANDTDHLERYGTLATKLLRTFTAQTEALAKLRRKGEQTVRVEHVHVYPGAQAVVGNLTTGCPEGGGRTGNGHQPHALAGHALAGSAVRALQAGPAMRGPDAGREPVPVPGGERQGALQDARRRPRKRGSRG